MVQKQTVGIFVMRLVAAVTFVAMVVVNALATLLPINGVTTAQVSDSYPNLFAPAGFTFAIWGVIYLLLAAYSVYQLAAWQAKSSRVSQAIDALTPYYIASSLVNIAWIFAWHYRLIGLTVSLMVVLLIVLIRINLILVRMSDSTILRVPFGVYLGWITVATVANIVACLVAIGWGGWAVSPDIWTAVIVGVASSIGIVTTIRLRNASYGLVIIWALYGILVKHLSPTGWNNAYPLVVVTLYAAMIACVVAIGYVLARSYGTHSKRRAR